MDPVLRTGRRGVNAAMDKVHLESEHIVNKLKEQGLNPGTTTEEYLYVLWNLYQTTENKLQTATDNLQELRLQQAEEMKEVESYVAHIRSLTEEREALTTDFEKENIQLRIELQKLRVEQESQLKEVEEMLDQEGLNDIASSSPSEQIAYLLVERATLLEKLEALEHKQNTHSEDTSDTRQNELEQIHRTLEEEIQQQRESMRRTKETLSKDSLSSLQKSWKKFFGTHKNAARLSADPSTFDEELDKEKKMRESVERDLNEAAQRLKMSHDEIRKLTDDLLIKKAETNDLDHVLKKKQEDFDALCQELKTLKDNGSIELQKAKEHNERLDREILSLRQRVRTLDAERKKLLEQHEKSESDSATTHAKISAQDDAELHKYCKLQLEEKESLNKQLLNKLQKLQREHEEIEERNEELESLLGETQNRTKEQNHYLECEIAGLQRTIMNLESELTELAEQQEMKEDQQKDKSLEEMSQLQQEVEMLRAKVKGFIDTELDNNKLKVKIDQLEREKLLQDNKVSELVNQCEKLQIELREHKSSIETEKQSSQQQGDRMKDLENEREAVRIALSEYKKKCEILQRQIHEEAEEKRGLREETLQLRQEVTVSRQDIQVRREENSRLKEQLSSLQDQVARYQCFGDGSSQNAAADSVRQQQYEEIRQLRQDLHRVQTVCSSAEKELRYERDKNLDVKKQHFNLQKENTKLASELNQVKEKLASVTAACSSLKSELEQRQQKIKEMELELLKKSQSVKVQSHWQEKLEQEKLRAGDAEKMVLELQQQLRASQHQLLLVETQMAEKLHLEEEVKRTREREAKLKVQLQEEQLKRRVAEQSLDDLQHEVKVLHEKEISLTQSNCSLQLKLHQQESRVQHLYDEKTTSSTERVQCENTNQKLSEELAHVQLEKEQLHKEYDRILKQLDDYIRKHNEKQLRHKAKLSRVKEAHLNEVNQRDLRIKQLEMELALSRKQAEKDQHWISKMTAENEQLHEEKRQLIQRVTEMEAADRNHKWILLSVQNRAHILDEENKQLQENLLQLYNQVGLLERVLKKLQALNLADITNIIPPECLLRPDVLLNETFSEYEPSRSPVLITPIDDATFGRAPEVPVSVSLSRSETSEVGYLNVVSPGVPLASPEQAALPVSCIDAV